MEINDRVIIKVESHKGKIGTIISKVWDRFRSQFVYDVDLGNCKSVYAESEIVKTRLKNVKKGHKVCIMCNKYLPLDAFPNIHQYKSSYCKECSKKIR